MIGKKYERKALLETILEPSKAIAPEYVPYLLETDGGQMHMGFLVERNADHVLLKDIKNHIIRVQADEVVELVPQNKSLMPELVLRDVTAQDAADLLSFLNTLKVGTYTASTFRILGPFDTVEQNLDDPLPPEKTLAAPDLHAHYNGGVDGANLRWEFISADGSLNYSGVDTVRFDKIRKLRGTTVTHYLMVYADTPQAQDVLLMIGADDGCKVWVNGGLVNRNPVSRGLQVSQDQVPCRLNEGRNVIVIKVSNGEGYGGASLAVRSTEPVNFKVE